MHRVCTGAYPPDFLTFWRFEGLEKRTTHGTPFLKKSGPCVKFTHSANVGTGAAQATRGSSEQSWLGHTPSTKFLAYHCQLRSTPVNFGQLTTEKT